MGHRHHSHHRKRKAYIYLAVLAVCIVAVALATWYLDRLEQQDRYGDLNSRFHSKITFDWGGKTYYYRENQVVNILLIGIDENEIDTAQTGYRGGGQADFLLLLAIDRGRKTITPVQISRDTVTGIDIKGVFGNPAGIKTTQICLAQAFGRTVDDRCRNTASAVSRLFSGIPINYYVAVDMSTINTFNNALGGVTVHVEEDMTNIDPAFEKGATVHLLGSQAEAYVRSRMGVISDPTNAGRMRRQRIYMVNAMERLSARVESEPTFLLHFLEETEGHLFMDLTANWMLDHAQTYNRYARADIWEPKGMNTYGEDGFAEFYPDRDQQAEMLINVFFDE